MPQYYDREALYKLADVEKYLGYQLCRDTKHYLNRNKKEIYYENCLYESYCCRHPDIEYLVQVTGVDYITKKYANELIGNKLNDEIEALRTYRFGQGIELERREPKYVHGSPMHPITSTNTSNKHKKSHRR